MYLQAFIIISTLKYVIYHHKNLIYDIYAKNKIKEKDIVIVTEICKI